MTEDERAELAVIAAGDQAAAHMRDKLDEEIAYIVIMLWLIWVYSPRRKHGR